MIDFINANNGGIEFHAGLENKVGFAKTAEMVAYIIETKGLANRVMHSSSMDFADEYDFANYDDAWKLWDKGLNILRDKGVI